jgi:hypothetical protein
MERSVLASLSPGRQSSIYSVPRRILNWNLYGPCLPPNSELESGNERYVYGKLIDGIF